MNQLKEKLMETAQRLRQASQEIEAVPGLQSQSKAMVERAQRLESNLFTVALFGAFSAGKSSFANALMGDLILPVSPNPTTAAINKIMPPTDAYPHGTVRVVVKSQAAIESDVLRSLEVFQIHASDLQSGLAKLASIEVAEIAPNAKPHYTFLKAVAKGLPEMSAHLGGELIVDMQAFKGFVAKEEKACFAEFIELYYQCPLTDQGIVLVDTPGADSINARHTGVAFEYMKNADAVLFVTYYNHAFSQADREFLLQMGRVKDTFELDKMFFVVNAADLAASQEELDGVLAHVEKNLLNCGIRNPRMYPISSQTALLGRMHEAGKLAGSAEKLYRQRMGTPDGQPLAASEQALQQSGMSRFEHDFFRFTLEELTQIAIDAAYTEIKRTDRMLQEMIVLAEAGETERQERKDRAIAQKQAALQAIQKLSVASEQLDLDKEREELLYYVRQRLFFRFNELFTLAFNPAVLKDDGRNLRQTLKTCLEELLRSISFDLAQELRATTLRLEKVLNRFGQGIIQRCSQAIAEHAAGLSLAAYQPRQIETPAFAEELPVGPDDLQAVLHLFKNPRDFFEQNGKTAMRDELEKRLQEPVSSYLANQGEKLAEQTARVFAELVETEREHVAQQVEEYFTGVFAALDMQLDLGLIREKQQTISRLLA
ncbi:dynamin family protein [Brevibacillus fulvus]|uniref:Replication fork clamp-binding protein CrfC n=1 Tax=Brevibacillus fulvus TaxID=1125967 RepID=A0A938Y3U4_9BACL|nr:dynamin family protein [Brevibacillus fulvus]MBM7590710.1 replication fork clamp-binding protein CrfC [Brevibacillus fulvus]